MTDIRILVTGSRDWPDDRSVERVLDALVAEFDGFKLVHGACGKGADGLADRWARGLGVECERYPAQWRDSFGRLNMKAGYERNNLMVLTRPRLCVAFVMPCVKHLNMTKHPSHGAHHCYSKAHRAGIETRVNKGGGL